MTDEPENEIVHRELSTERESPAPQLVESIAELEDKEISELPTMYECVDGVLDNLFSNPPAPKAQMQVEFSYDTYRIKVEQDGTAEFIKTG